MASQPGHRPVHLQLFDPFRLNVMRNNFRWRQLTVGLVKFRRVGSTHLSGYRHLQTSSAHQRLCADIESVQRPAVSISEWLRLRTGDTKCVSYARCG